MYDKSKHNFYYWVGENMLVGWIFFGSASQVNSVACVLVEE